MVAFNRRGLGKGHKGNDSPVPSPILLEDWGMKMESKKTSSLLLGTENKNGDVASSETRSEEVRVVMFANSTSEFSTGEKWQLLEKVKNKNRFFAPL